MYRDNIKNLIFFVFLPMNYCSDVSKKNGAIKLKKKKIVKKITSIFFSIYKAIISEKNLPVCQSEKISEIVFIVDTKKFMHCKDGAWVDVALPDSDILEALKCEKTKILKWYKNSWACADDKDLVDK